MFKDYIELKNRVAEYLQKSANFFHEIGDVANANKVQNLLNDIDNQRFNITILANMNRGKSTLLNTLMGRKNDDISPINSLVCTASILKYLDASLLGKEDKEKAIVYFHEKDGNKHVRTKEISLSRVRDYVTENKNSKNAKGVSHVEVYGKFPEWSRAVTFVDSPGLNSVHVYHDEIVIDHLPRTDALVVLISADLPLDGGDMDMLKRLKNSYQRKIFFVLSKTDAVDSDELNDEIIPSVKDKLVELDFCGADLYPIAARPVYEAICKGAEEDELEKIKEENGILDLEEKLEEYIKHTSNELLLLAQRVKDIADKTSLNMNRYKEIYESDLNDKDNKKAKYQALVKNFDLNKDALRNKLRSRLPGFKEKVNVKLNLYNQKLDEKVPFVKAALNNALKDKNFIDISLNLRNIVKDELVQHIIPLNAGLSESLVELVEQLNNEFKIDIKEFNNNACKEPNVSTKPETIVQTGTTAVILGVNGYFAEEAFSATQNWYEAYNALIAAESKEGVLDKVWGFFTGDSEVNDLTTAYVIAKGVAVKAIVNLSITAVVSLALFKAVRWGIVLWQKKNLGTVVDDFVDKLKTDIKKSLDDWNNCIIKKIEENIDLMIQAEKQKLEKIEADIADDTPEGRQKLSDRLSKIDELNGERNNILAELQTLQIQ